MIEYFDTHQYAFWVSIGFAMLVIEVLALGLSSGVLLFAALGALAVILLGRRGHETGKLPACASESSAEGPRDSISPSS